MKHKTKNHNRVILKKAISLIAAAIFLSQQAGWTYPEYSLRPLPAEERNNRTDDSNNGFVLLNESQVRLYRTEFLEKARIRFKESYNPKAWTWEQVSKIPDAIRALAEYCRKNKIDIREFLGGGGLNKKNPIITEIISLALGRSATTGNALYLCAKKYCDNWDNALRAAGFDPEGIRQHPPWTQEQEERIPDVIRAIAAYCRQNSINMSDILSSVAIRYIQDPKIHEIISSTLKRKETTALALYAHVKEMNVYGRSWDAALKSGDLNPDEIRRKLYWTADQEDKIPDALRAIAEYYIGTGRDVSEVLSYKGYLTDDDPMIAEIISDVLGRKGTTAVALRSHVVGTQKRKWDEVLREAGFNPAEIRGWSPWTSEQEKNMPEAVKAVAEYYKKRGVNASDAISLGAISSDFNPDVTNIISGILGRKGTTGNALVIRAHAVPLYKGWDGLLMAADFVPEDIRKSSGWTPEQEKNIPEAVKAVGAYCEKKGINVSDILSLTAFRSTSDPEIVSIISNVLQRPGTTPPSLVAHTLGYVKSYGYLWDNVLIAAGYVPDDIRKRLYWTPQQEEKIPDAIKAVAEYCERNHIPISDVLSVHAIQQNTNTAVTEIISKTLKRKGTTGRALYIQTLKTALYNRSWKVALEIAGLEVESVRKITPGRFGRPSWWNGRCYRSILERDTAIILSFTKLLPENEMHRGKNWERPFYKMDSTYASYVDFYSNNGHGPIIFEPHGMRNGETLKEYRARRLQEYQGTWAAEVPQDNVFVFDNTRTLIQNLLPRIGINVTPSQLAQIDQLITASEEETRQHLAEYDSQETAAAIAEPGLDTLMPELEIALAAI